MKPKDQTISMLHWWHQVGIDRADLAVRRPDGAMLWHADLPLRQLPLAWARAENVSRADVYVRPARGFSWPAVFLDDVPVDVAHRVARKYAALVVQTSPVGGTHLWIASRRRLDEVERAEAQRWLASQVSADLASTSGEHLGRLAGFKNWKRDGVWVNVRGCCGGLPWDPSPILPFRNPPPRPASRPHASVSSKGPDVSASGREWGWVCGRLEAGAEPLHVYRDLAAQARRRRGKDADRYAGRTLVRALRHLGI